MQSDMKLEAFGALSNFEFNILDVVMRNEMHWFLNEKEKLFEKVQVSVVAADMAAQCLSLVCRFVVTFRNLHIEHTDWTPPQQVFSDMYTPRLAFGQNLGKYL
jgi:hypothetical protein